MTAWLIALDGDLHLQLLVLDELGELLRCLLRDAFVEREHCLGSTAADLLRFTARDRLQRHRPLHELALEHVDRCFEASLGC